MKLTIHEIVYLELITGKTIYRYIIELNDYVMKSITFDYKLSNEEFIPKMFSLLDEELLKDPNINNRFVFDWQYIPSDTKHKKYEIKLDDTYIKDLLLRKKMEAIEKDFV